MTSVNGNAKPLFGPRQGLSAGNELPAVHKGSIRDAGKVKARERIAVLAALNIAYDAAHRDPALAFRNSSFGAAEGEHAHAESLAPDAERRLRELVNRIDAALADDRLL